MLHITLTKKKRSDDPDDPLHRAFYGWDPHDTIERNWANNRGYWVLGARASRESYVLFSYNDQREVVMAARIDAIIDAPGKPGRKIIEGQPLPEDHPVHREYVGGPTPHSARVRNPVTYFGHGLRFCAHRRHDLTTRNLHAGDRLLLCSDGVSPVVPDDLIYAALSSSAEPAATADHLIQVAIDHGGPDNATVVVID